MTRKKYKKRVDFVDLLGRRFGSLSVVEYLGRINGASYWKCVCDCGNLIKIRGFTLKKGRDYCSPECKNRPIESKKKRPYSKLESLIGKRFGRLEVVERLEDKIEISKGKIHRRRVWMCRCDCGNFSKKDQGGLMQGFYKRCGRHCGKYNKRLEEIGAEGVRKETAPMLYFIKVGEFVKIGVTKNLKMRMAQLSTHSPVRPVLINAFYNAGHIEKSVHSEFSDIRKNGEWFELTEQVLKFVKEMEFKFRPVK